MGYEGLRKINPVLLRQIDRLFTHRWEAFVIANLASGPLRFSQLAFEVQMATKKRVSDSSLSRINAQLVRADLIQKVPGDDKHDAYALTPRGERVAEMLLAITHALEDLQGDGDELQARPPRQRAQSSMDTDQDLDSP